MQNITCLQTQHTTFNHENFGKIEKKQENNDSKPIIENISSIYGNAKNISTSLSSSNSEHDNLITEDDNELLMINETQILMPYMTGDIFCKSIDLSILGLFKNI